MEVLSMKYPGLIIICDNCGAVLANIQKSDIYSENLVYCPVCKHCNTLNHNKNYEGIITNDNDTK